jgi:CBS domain containing-hemolysin-like protein
MTGWLLVLAAVALTAGTALFVTAEFSLVALDRGTVQQAVDDGDERASTVLRSLRQLSTQLSAAQVGITLTTLVVGYLAEPSIGSLIQGPLEALGLSPGAATSVGTALALVLVTLFSMVFGELLPQFLGISAPLAAAKVVAGPVRAFAVVVRPLVAILNGSANAALRAMGITPQEELSGARTPQELASLVRRSAEQGTLEEGTARMLTRTLGFGDRTASDVMTPRMRCSGIERTSSAEDVIRLARQTGHSRFPVVGDDWDDIDGLVHVKRAIAVPHDRRPDVPVSALMVPPVLVPETIRLDPLLLQLRLAGLQMVVVVDEYGGTSGVVTLEDVVEEIVGEVNDEHDRGQADWQPMGDGTFLVPGLWRPDQVREEAGAMVPDGPAYETVGGFVMAALGRIPEVGDEVPITGWRLRVARMDGRRVDRLRFIPVPEPGDEHADGTSGGETGGEGAAGGAVGARPADETAASEAQVRT